MRVIASVLEPQRAAANAALKDSVIRLMGRWNSDAFHRYIRTPRDTLAGYSSALLRGTSGTASLTAPLCVSGMTVYLHA